MAPISGIFLKGLFFPSNKPFPDFPFTNRDLVIPHSAHLHFIILRPFRAVELGFTSRNTLSPFSLFYK